MRQLIAALVVLGLPALAAAQSQSSGKSSASPSGTLPQVAAPLPPIGLPLPSIGLPLPSIGLQLSPTTQRQHPKTDPTFGTRHDQNHRRRSHPAPTVVYFGMFYPWAGESQPAPGMVAPSVAAAIEERLTGRLRLEVEPANMVQLFVDGVYVGTPDDVGDELAMEPGVRRIEIRAEGYETLKFDARIVAGQTITYRGSLRPVAPESPPAPSSVPAPPASHTSPQARTMYFIPGCYLGNIPPGEIKLPSGCDLSRLIIRRP